MSDFREQIRKRGEEFGLVFAERTLLSNTRMVLQAAEFARDEGDFEGFHEAVFRAYFSEGRDIGSPEVIAAVADSCGLDPGRMMSAVESGVNLPRLEAARLEGDSLGLTGIPLFLINSRFEIVGAQAPEVFRNAFKMLGAAPRRS
jgi:predicted DsbA family dithiol-disulfide isomerase